MPDISGVSINMAFDVDLTTIGPISNVTSTPNIGNGDDKTLEKMASLSGTIQWKKLFKTVRDSAFLNSKANNGYQL